MAEEEKKMLQDRKLTRRQALKGLAGLAVSIPLSFALTVPAGAAAPLPAPRAAPAFIPRRAGAGVVIDARTTEAAGLDPHNVPALANFRITHLLYDRLVWLDRDLVVQPRLADSWEIPNLTTYIFHLHPGVKFHDGTELTAEDVKATVERVLDEKTGSQVRGDLLPVDSVEVVDKYIAKFNLKTPYSGLLAALFNVAITPKSVNSQPLDFLKSKEIGTGPWMLDSWTPDVEMKLVRNPNYWRPGVPKLDGITIRVMPDESSIIAALRSGDVHHAVLEDNKNYALVKDDPNLQTWRTPALGTNVININHRKQPLQNVMVRQAMAMAMNRDEILQAAGSGLGVVSGPIPPVHKLWSVPISDLPFYQQDVAGAKALLAQAGFPNGFDMDIIYIPQFPLMDISAQVLAGQWQAIGINAQPRATEYGVWLDLRVKTFDYWISTNLDFPTIDPDQYLYNTFHTGSSPAGWDNWSDPEIDGLLDAGRATTDTPTRQQIYTLVQKQLCQKVAAFWSYAAEHVEVASQRLQNYTPHPTTYVFGMEEATLSG